MKYSQVVEIVFELLMKVKFQKLECVVLAHDLPGHGLRAGDLGTVVEAYPEGGLEVEFVRGSGLTQALLTLNNKDARKIDPHDHLAPVPGGADAARRFGGGDLQHLHLAAVVIVYNGLERVHGGDGALETARGLQRTALKYHVSTASDGNCDGRCH